MYSIDYLENTVLRGIDTALIAEYRLFTGLGLAVAAGTGIIGMAAGFPFLTHDYWVFHHLPVYGDLHVASAFAFDLGIYIVVTAALLTIIAVVGEE
jgi:multicomponent Na+:H+ antiporter subunit B